MSSTWIVVADACRARFFSANKPAGLRDLISDEIANDLTTQTPERIRAQLSEYL